MSILVHQQSLQNSSAEGGKEKEVDRWREEEGKEGHRMEEERVREREVRRGEKEGG